MGKTTGQPLLKNGSTGSVDGIAGPKTLNSLYSTGASMGNPRSEPSMVAIDGGGGSSAKPKEDVAEEPPVFNYTQSETVASANQLLADQWNSMPGAYQSQWTSKINDYMSKIENRDPFSYNFNEDGLYQMYKDHYTQMGQMAMMDTIGQVAAMTGGYGNSYAQSVGQQAYNQQLAQLNNIIPDLYQMAYNRYRDEGQDLLNMYNMYMDRENMDYGRHQDALNNWWKQTEYLTGRADTEYERDYNSQWDSYTAENDNYWKEYSANYQEGRDAIEDQKDRRDWITDMISAGIEPSDEDLAAAGMTRAEADAWKSAYIASENNDGNTRYNNGKLTQKQVEELQKILGVTVDGLWGSKSSKAAGGMTADEAWDAYQNGELSSKPTGDPQPGATGIPEYITSKVSSFTTNEDLAQYLDEQTSLGKITEAQADDLYAQYKQADKVGLSSRTWTVVDDGGVNWFWGVDNNAKVKDQYGETYTMDQLVDALVAEGMDKKAAKDYVKNLQDKLRI